MNWPGRLAVVFLLLASVGCARDQDYLDVAKDRQAAMEELVATLESIKDAASMAEAKRTLQSNAEKYDAIAQRAEALPKPPPARVQEKFRQDLPLVNATIEHAKVEIHRVSKLPGGAEFLRQFKSTKGLLSAVQQ